MIGILIAVVFAALVYAICVALGLPSFVVLSLPERSLLTTVAHVGATE